MRERLLVVVLGAVVVTMVAGGVGFWLGRGRVVMEEGGEKGSVALVPTETEMVAELDEEELKRVYAVPDYDFSVEIPGKWQVRQTEIVAPILLGVEFLGEGAKVEVWVSQGGVGDEEKRIAGLMGGREGEVLGASESGVGGDSPRRKEVTNEERKYVMIEGEGVTYVISGAVDTREIDEVVASFKRLR